MSRQYDRYERTTRRSALAGPRRSGLGHWIPFALTIAVATVGLAAWIWSERQEDDEEEDDPNRPPRPEGDYPPRSYPPGDYPPSGYPPGTYPPGNYPPGGYPPNNYPPGSFPPPPGTFPAPPVYGEVRQGEAAYGTTAQAPEGSSSYVARMSGALKRAPSPQEIFDNAARTVTAGVGAVGAVVGSALSSIREEDKNAFRDHKTWSEEAELRKTGASTGAASTASKALSQRPPASASNVKRRTVAVVISADADGDGLDDGGDYHTEHASILSHLPRNIDFSKTRLFVLIYAPFLKEHPLDATSSRPPASLSSSFSNIGHEQILTPNEEVEKPLASATPGFDALWSQAQTLVEKDTMILPFTTPTGHVHILRHLAPDFVYLQESLSGNNGDIITHLQTWLRHNIVLVVGADGGHGGLADSESEAEHAGKGKPEQWWEREDRVGRGRGVVVVEGIRVGDDWARRIDGKE